MATTNRYLDDFSKIDWADRIVKILSGITRPIIEVGLGIKARAIPLHICFLAGNIMTLLIITGLDRKIFNLIHFGYFKMSLLYPTSSWLYWLYCFFALTLGFWIWGCRQTYLRRKLIERLTDVFTSAGLKNPLGKLPSFICDVPIDEFTRKLRVTRANFSKKTFEKAKELLESSLQVYIDEIKEARENGTIDIIYSHAPMPTYTEIDNIKEIGALNFIVGKTRAKQIICNFKQVPHLMIAGLTGGGKSTLLRSLITTIYINNKDFEFTLIDLKGGLEFQLFENLPRIDVIPSIGQAVDALEVLKNSLDSRMQLLKGFGCKDIDAYHQLVKLKKAQTKDVVLPDLKRHLIVVDEAAELFLTGGGVDNQQIQTARRIMSQLARQGRSVGFNLVIATQRPDSRAVDPQVKSNLPGILCFQMLNDSSSITVLGNGRASDLPAIPGRAIWKCGTEMIEVQTPFLGIEQAEKLLRGPGEKIKAPQPSHPILPESQSNHKQLTQIEDKGTPL
jgi:energy-coupling factor transporter ATP-binding protein EcfA2